MGWYRLVFSLTAHPGLSPGRALSYIARPGFRCARSDLRATELASKRLRVVSEGCRLPLDGVRDREVDVDRDRVTIQEAARRLGVSEGAIRKRVKRGTLEHDKERDGRVYVYLPGGVDEGVDEGRDEGVDPNNTALISQLRDEVTYLRDENRRKDEIIMQQAMTMRQLSAPPEPQDAPSEAESRPDRGTGAQEPERTTERRSWWRKVFGDKKPGN